MDEGRVDEHDPDSKTARKALRHELRMVAVRPRRWGLWLLTIGLMLMLAPAAWGIHSLWGWSPLFLGMAAACVSVPLLAASIWLRRRYARQRRTLISPRR